MGTILNSSRVLPPFSAKSFASSSTFRSQRSFFAPRFPSLRCRSGSEENGSGNDGSNFKDAVSGMVDEQVQELLSKEENRVLLDGLEEASRRVEIAKRELALIQEQELAAKRFRDYVNQLESQASEIAECQREISEAKAMVEEAERTLSQNMDGPEGGNTFMWSTSEEIDRDKERWESVKAASISALVGTLAGLPICLTQVSNFTELILPLAINFISSALFGVTFRYAVRRNLDDVQLKTGTAAAFGVVKEEYNLFRTNLETNFGVGLATLGGGPVLELNLESFLSHALDGVVYVSENLLVFVFAAVSLDYCFKTRLLSPFPIDRSVSSDNSK
ncbi:homer protein [Senna tora]|uniref:Homer protein n=1 Tax=Senna tora TaxID=362788 RepID=A0A834TM92_9FABA|nr:homer protein [Senna tora]